MTQQPNAQWITLQNQHMIPSLIIVLTLFLSLSDWIEDFLDEEGLIFTKYSPILRLKLLVGPLVTMGRASFLDLTPRNNSAVSIKTEKEGCETPTLPCFAERRRTMLTQFKSHFHDEDVKLNN